MKTALLFKLLGASLLGLLLLVLVGPAVAKDKPGQGKGREKVVLCHKGKVMIRVARPAVRAHLRHGDTLGPCGRAPAPHTATLTVIKRVVNDNGGAKTPADFTLTINGVTAQGGNSFAGSASGVSRTITTFGSYKVTESAVAGYTMANASAGCSGTIAAGQSKSCVITNDDQSATITVFKQVINDNGGTKTAADFALTINGVTAIGGNTFAGSTTGGVTRTLATVGPYNVTETAVPGYALTGMSSQCSGTIALGEHKTCVLTNNDVQS
jgi:Prealbumin-like fold domain